MELSHYNIFVDDVSDGTSSLVFNTRTQAIIRLERQIANKLRQRDFSSIPSDYLVALREQGVVVDSIETERALMQQFFHYICEDMRKIPYEVTILTTYACNFACVYCFEEDVKSPVYMSQNTAKAVVDWTVEQVRKREYRFLYIVFYGGEPFLNYPMMEFLAERYWEEAKNRGFRIGFGIITNGSLLNRKKVLWLKDKGLREIRVTLDGPARIHNKRRPFRDGRGSFEVILKNLKEIKGIVDLAISCNFDENTAEYMEELLDILIAEDVAPYISYLIFSPIMPRLERRGERITVGLNNCALLFKDQGLFEKSQELAQKAVDKGLNVRSQLTINLCPMVMRDGAVTVDPEGKLYRCNSFVGFEEFCVGDVFSGWNCRYEEFLKIKPWENCPQDCVYLPMCQGGCRFFAFIEKADLRSTYCCREYLDRNISYLIKLEYSKKCNKKRSE